MRRIEQENVELTAENTEFSTKRREIRDHFIVEMQERLLMVEDLYLTFLKLSLRAQEDATTLATEKKLVQQMDRLLDRQDRADFKVQETFPVSRNEQNEVLQLRMDRLLNS